MRKNDVLKQHYEDEIEYLQGEKNSWRDRALSAGSQIDLYKEQIDLYKKILDKVLNGPDKRTDLIFMFEGKAYRPVEFTLNREDGIREDRLSVDFVAMG